MIMVMSGIRSEQLREPCWITDVFGSNLDRKVVKYFCWESNIFSNNLDNIRVANHKTFLPAQQVLS